MESWGLYFVFHTEINSGNIVSSAFLRLTYSHFAVLSRQFQRSIVSPLWPSFRNQKIMNPKNKGTVCLLKTKSLHWDHLLYSVAAGKARMD